jgi:hypothetical protein
MADDVWGRPRIPTGDSVAAALRLAREVKPDESLLAERVNGATELLVTKRGELRRYLVHESGATEQVETRAPMRRFGFLRKGHELEPFVPAGAASARIPYKLDGWRPRTVAQLSAVEERCTTADENVRVREMADGAVELVTYKKRQRRREVLDAFGASVEQDVSEVSGGVYWTVKLGAFSLFIPFAALIAFHGMRYFIAGLVVYLIICLLGARVDARKHRVRPGEEWFEIQLEPPSD